MALRRVMAAVVGLALGGISEARAADAAPEATLSGDTFVLDRVTVTAQKREEDQQDVPLSMQSFRVDALAEKGIDNIRELGLVVPSLQFTAVAGFPLVFLRGLGTDNIVPSADPSVAIYIDGIYTPIGIYGITSLAGIKSVEVIKGPQGTLFGRDATGGAISVVTDNPGERFKVTAETEATNFNGRIAKLSLSGPVTSWLAAGASGVYDRKDSPFSDLYFSPARDALEAARLKLLFHVDDVSLNLTAYQGGLSGTGSMIAQNTNPSLLGSITGIQPQRDSFAAQNDHQGYTRDRQALYYGIFKWLTPGLDLKLLGSYQRLRTPESSIDFDGSPQPLVVLGTTNTFTQLQTAELQLLSNDRSWFADRFKWVAGAYYQQGRVGVDPITFQIAPNAIEALTELSRIPSVTQLGSQIADLVNALGLANTPLGMNGLTLAFRSVLGTRSESVYSQGTYSVLDSVDLTLGLRAQHEERFLTKSVSDLESPLGAGELQIMSNALSGASADNLSPKIATGWHPVPAALLYASYSVAYKSGTYNIVNVLTSPTYILPEKVGSYEVGGKFESTDQSARVNVALFDTNIHNLQSGFVSVFSAGRVEFVTVPHARSRGGELDARWIAVKDRNPLVLSFNAAYVEAVYTDFPNGPGYQAGTGLYTGNLDLTGNRMDYTPRWSGTVGAAQGISCPRGALQLGVDEYFNSGFFTDADNGTHEGAYALLNAHASYRDVPTGLSVTALGTNLLDRRYHTVNLQTDFGTVKSLAPPRIVGLTMAWTW